MFKSKEKSYVSEYNKQYYIKNKTKKYKKYYCEYCKDEYRDLARHNRTKKHLKFFKKPNTPF